MDEPSYAEVMDVEHEDFCKRIAALEGENERLGSALYRIQCDRCSQPVGGYIETPEDGPLQGIIVPARFCPLCAAGWMPCSEPGEAT